MSRPRTFLAVPDFERRQNPKRPRRPTWIKAYVSDLDDPELLELSLAVRGFLAQFALLAADLNNRVPDDVGYIARRLAIRPAVAGKALHKCITHGRITRFAPREKTRVNSELEKKIDSRSIPSAPPSLSISHSPSLSTYRSTEIATEGRGADADVVHHPSSESGAKSDSRARRVLDLIEHGFAIADVARMARMTQSEVEAIVMEAVG